METIGRLSLENKGGFLVRLYFYYWDKSQTRTLIEATGAYPIGESRTVNPGDFGVPDNSPVSIYASVVLGEDNSSPIQFLYSSACPQVIAKYVISGTTFDNTLARIEDESIKLN